jgi:hypothetical protein
MTLREQESDDFAMFFDPDEMGSEHLIVTDASEKTILCVLDNDQGMKNSLQSPGGIYDGNLLFFAKTADLTGLQTNMMIQFDGVPYVVSGVVEEDGISQVTLSSSRGGF